jgi:hypothetical protein
MADDAREFGWGFAPTEDFVGLVGPMAMWDVVLDAADVGELFNPATGTPFEIDLTSNVGAYDKSANLLHFYRPTQYDPGTTDRAGSLDLTNGGATQGDVVSDAPA